MKTKLTKKPDHYRSQSNSFFKKHAKKTIFVFFVICLLISSIVYINVQMEPVSKAPETIVFTIDSGDGYIAIVNKLEQEGIIRNAWLTRTLKHYSSTDFLPGEYTLDKSWSTDAILTYLSDNSNSVVDVSVTILPQDWAKVAAEKIAAATQLNASDILNAWNDDAYLSTLIQDYSVLTPEILNSNTNVKLEGYIYPETYRFYKDSSIDQVTRKILDQTQSIYESLKNEFDQSALSVHGVFTLASIVGFEASDDVNQKLIAGVFYNRLAIDMRLQSSVTVCYALYDYSHWRDCETNPTLDSPYNTYVYRGLPVGPIMNPTYSVLKATLEPTTSDYFYFLADVTTGKVYYQKTYEEHLQDKEKYIQ